jgi:hypothetical protein
MLGLPYPKGLACGYLGDKEVQMKPRWGSAVLLFLWLSSSPLFAYQSENSFFFRGGFYLDWYGSQYEGGDFYNQLSFRLKSEMISRRGSGWTLLVDARDRLRLSQHGNNHVLLYDARLSFEKPESRWYVSAGQMNLYDTAGIGQLLGGVLGFKAVPDLLLGVYAGLESSVYIDRVDNDYRKYGFFARYLGSKGKRLSLSYNQVRYSGQTERQYVYAGSLMPISRSFVLYGNIEYELAAHVRSRDRLNRLFLNLRWDPAEFIDITGHYSSGKGLDYHRYLIERSKDPTLNDKELERFYYSLYYGLRLSIKPKRGLRFFLARQESEQKDKNVRNHTWRFGASFLNIYRTGLTAYGSYALNRGEISESDSYYLSVTKDFGRLSWNFSFSNTFNGIRYDVRSGTPEVIHLDDYKTFSTHVFLPLTRMVAVSAEYEYFLQKEADQHLFFLRFILRN